MMGAGLKLEYVMGGGGEEPMSNMKCCINVDLEVHDTGSLIAHKSLRCTGMFFFFLFEYGVVSAAPKIQMSKINGTVE